MTELATNRDERIASLIWTWYGQDEYRRIILVGELAPALVFLTQDSESQRRDIGCCAECNLWSDYLEYLDNFVNRFPERLEPRLFQLLQTLLASCMALGPAAYGTLTENGFDDPQWQLLREVASQALEQLGWTELQEHLPSLTEDCRAALRKWPDTL